MRTIVCVGLLGGLLLSPKLWLSTRDYPLSPVFGFLPAIRYPLDHIIPGVMLVLLALIAGLPRPSRLIAIFVPMAVCYALFDQERWQPWFYQYLLMLVAIGLDRPETCRLMIACIYFWSGIQKINPGFAHETFPWMLGPLGGTWLAAMGYVVPVAESAIGIGLVTRRLRSLAVIGAVAMHLFILASIGPLGHRHNVVVWPWNMAMAVLVVMLFRATPEVGARKMVWGKGMAFQSVVLVLFGVLPALSLVDLWDSYLSFTLYSGNQRNGTIYMSDAVAGRLPDEVQEVVGVYESEWKVDTLDLEEWSYAELNVPGYPEVRVFRNVARRICGELGNPGELVLVVEGRRFWFRRRRMSVYTCGMLDSRKAVPRDGAW